MSDNPARRERIPSLRGTVIIAICTWIVVLGLLWLVVKVAA